MVRAPQLLNIAGAYGKGVQGVQWSVNEGNLKGKICQSPQIHYDESRV